MAKNVFELRGVNAKGSEVFRKRVRRGKLLSEVGRYPGSIVAFEACGGAHYWGREFERQGHEVRIISPQFVKPYVKSNKNDEADAEAICEAAQRPTMRFVGVKSTDQQDLQSLHRVRERLVRSRTALSNEVRGLLLEYGITIAKGITHVRRRLPELLEEHEKVLSARMRQLLRKLYEELITLDARVAELDTELGTVAKEHPVCQKLVKVPGVGPLTATAVIAAVGNPQAFKNGREFAAWLGLVPKHRASGERRQLLGISKRGDKYLRKLLVHGARSAVRQVGRRTDRRSQWAKALVERRGMNKATVAYANKTARILWVLLAKDVEYQEYAVA